MKNRNTISRTGFIVAKGVRVDVASTDTGTVSTITVDGLSIDASELLPVADRVPVLRWWTDICSDPATVCAIHRSARTLGAAAPQSITRLTDRVQAGWQSQSPSAA